MPGEIVQDARSIHFGNRKLLSYHLELANSIYSQKVDFFRHLEKHDSAMSLGSYSFNNDQF